MYAYANNDPVNFKDPGGLFGVPADGGDDEGGDDQGGVPVSPGPRKPAGPIPADPPPPSLKDLLQAAKLRLILELSSTQCDKAIGAASIRAADNAVNSISMKYSNLGAFQVTTNSSGAIVGVSGGDVVGQYSGGFLGIGKGISLNNQVNWFDPSAMMATDQNGNSVTYNLLDAKAFQVGATDGMTAEQFMDLTLLHELAHSFGVDHPAGDSSAEDTKIWNDCLK
jgi:hypothetical protein